MGSELSRAAAVAALSFRGSLRGLRALGLGAFAAVPALIELAVVGARPGPGTVAATAEVIFGQLTVPIVDLLILLVLGVSQFRSEIDAETLLYLSDRSVRRPTIVLGKFVGSTLAALALTIPAALLPIGIAVAGGAPAYPANVPLALGVATVLAAVAYGAFFLFLGLITRSALLLGLIYGIIWEELLSVLPGSAPELTVLYYLRSTLSHLVPSGPLGQYATSLPLSVVVVVPIAFAAVVLVFAGALFRYVETAPVRETA
jgi:ABC-2 type transport system permease protein